MLLLVLLVALAPVALSQTSAALSALQFEVAWDISEIAIESSRAISTEASIAALLGNEIYRAESQESYLFSLISSEKARDSRAVAAISLSLSSETSTAEYNENALNYQLSSRPAVPPTLSPLPLLRLPHRSPAQSRPRLTSGPELTQRPSAPLLLRLP